LAKGNEQKRAGRESLKETGSADSSTYFETGEGTVAAGNVLSGGGKGLEAGKKRPFLVKKSATGDAGGQKRKRRG